MTNINLYCADALDWMRSQPDSIYDLIIADPPYNVGKDYGNDSDKSSRSDQLSFMKSWTAEAARLLKPTGTLYAFMGFKFISYLYDALEQNCHLKFNNWICWHYTQGLGRKRGFSARHDDVLMFTKSDLYKFNLDAIRVPQKYYRSINNMRGANPGDVWEFSHVHYCQGNRQPHPSQKPEGLIERMVRASSDPNDLVLDPFAGSGTTLRVCQQLGRRCDGVEINADFVEQARKRLAEGFNGFDSVDPRMRRVPRDLRDPTLRATYVKNHIAWFLDHHEDQVASFLASVDQMYPEAKLDRSMKSIAKQPDDLFSAG